MPRQAVEPTSTRGKAIWAILRARKLGIAEAAKLARVQFRTLHDLMHREPPPKLLAETVARLHRVLGIPIRLLCPELAAALAGPSSE